MAIGAPHSQAEWQGLSEENHFRELHAALLARVEALENHASRAITMRAEIPLQSGMAVNGLQDLQEKLAKCELEKSGIQKEFATLLQREHDRYQRLEMEMKEVKARSEAGAAVIIREGSTTEVGDAIDLLFQQAEKQFWPLFHRLGKLEGKWQELGPEFSQDLNFAMVSQHLKSARTTWKTLQEERDVLDRFSKMPKTNEEQTPFERQTAENGHVTRDPKDAEELQTLVSLNTSLQLRDKSCEDALRDIKRTETSLLEVWEKLRKAQSELEKQPVNTSGQEYTEQLREQLAQTQNELDSTKQALARAQNERQLIQARDTSESEARNELRSAKEALVQAQSELLKARQSESDMQHMQASQARAQQQELEDVRLELLRLKREHALEKEQMEIQAQDSLNKIKMAHESELQLEAERAKTSPVSIEIDSLQATHKQELQHLEYERAAMQHTMSQLQTDLAHAKARNATDCDELRASLDKERAQRRDEVSALSKMLSQQKFDKNTEQDLASLRAQVTDLQSLLDKERSRNMVDVQEEIAALRKRTSEEKQVLLEEKAKLSDRVSQLEISIAASEQQNAQCTAELKKAKDEANATIIDLRCQIEQDLRSMSESTSFMVDRLDEILPQNETAVPTSTEALLAKNKKLEERVRLLEGVRIRQAEGDLQRSQVDNILVSGQMSPYAPQSGHASPIGPRPLSPSKTVPTAMMVVPPLQIPSTVTGSVASMSTPTHPQRGASPLRSTSPLPVSMSPSSPTTLTPNAPCPPLMHSPTVLKPPPSFATLDLSARAGKRVSSNRYANGVFRQSSDPSGRKSFIPSLGADAPTTGQPASCHTSGCQRSSWNGQATQPCCLACPLTHGQSHSADCNQRCSRYNVKHSGQFPPQQRRSSSTGAAMCTVQSVMSPPTQADFLTAVGPREVLATRIDPFPLRPTLQPQQRFNSQMNPFRKMPLD